MVKNPAREAEIKDELQHLDKVEADLKKTEPLENPEGNKYSFVDTAPIEAEVKPEPPKFTKIAASPDKHDNEFSTYPFHDLKIGEGFFVANEDIRGDALRYLRKEAAHVNDCYSVAVHDVNGDEVWENLHVHGFKRNDNPKYNQFGEIVDEFELDSSGNPIRSVAEVSRPKYVSYRYFSVKSVVKDDIISGTTKAPADGVVVTRES